MEQNVMTHSEEQPSTQNELLLVDIRRIVEQARGQVKQTVNTAMLQAYWQIGRLIVEDEQGGETRAAYGKATLKRLSQQLSTDYGRGFDITNLRNMRRFYLAFEKRDAVRLELSWTHYRVLLRVDSSSARNWYRDEAILQNWSARALERQIGTLYYERLLSSKNKQPVEQGIINNLQPFLLGLGKAILKIVETQNYGERCNGK
ncbi:DUF1016 N-terminal domain-containing protein [Pseudoalteromonas neustonica]|uniref:DUF1016 N-terminal domain-containing protein n=1 Tax=Pseudoalteromonas neustonica TaxID=1840331 RepID=UPI001FCCEABE|nr:DUF1016 N-terminal domain-containing protein [Pseudoalteromonas neustonica]